MVHYATDFDTTDKMRLASSYYMQYNKYDEAGKIYNKDQIKDAHDELVTVYEYLYHFKNLLQAVSK